MSPSHTSLCRTTLLACCRFSPWFRRTSSLHTSRCCKPGIAPGFRFVPLSEGIVWRFRSAARTLARFSGGTYRLRSLSCLPCFPASLVFARGGPRCAHARADQLYGQVAKRREALVQANSPSAEGGLVSRQTSSIRPHIVLVLENLSASLPDSAYLTRISIEKDRANIAGIALNPPELVPILEKTGHFSDVSFSDATTRSETGAGSHFSLEMRIGGEKKAPAE